MEEATCEVEEDSLRRENEEGHDSVVLESAADPKPADIPPVDTEIFDTTSWQAVAGVLIIAAVFGSVLGKKNRSWNNNPNTSSDYSIAPVPVAAPAPVPPVVIASLVYIPPFPFSPFGYPHAAPYTPFSYPAAAPFFVPVPAPVGRKTR